ncbi:hypothetical protein [Mammaliicoccus vitulinus]|uniref:hypothetical protein n=1 Tax=Mammaliicoccus vitulinus TaxID=71237 RepID=UPI00248BE24C|nr:hypothetical protein [Mammaliicoccus vitulinus]
MPEYIVKKNNGITLATGSLLSELIEHIVLMKISEIEKNTNVLSRLDKDLYKYLNQLSCFYSLSSIHAAAIEMDWQYIENFLDIYNQEKYINKCEFIVFEKYKEEKVV